MELKKMFRYWCKVFKFSLFFSLLVLYIMVLLSFGTVGSLGRFLEHCLWEFFNIKLTRSNSQKLTLYSCKKTASKPCKILLIKTHRRFRKCTKISNQRDNLKDLKLAQIRCHKLSISTTNHNNRILRLLPRVYPFTLPSVLYFERLNEDPVLTQERTAIQGIKFGYHQNWYPVISHTHVMPGTLCDTRPTLVKTGKNKCGKWCGKFLDSKCTISCQGFPYNSGSILHSKLPSRISLWNSCRLVL